MNKCKVLIFAKTKLIMKKSIFFISVFALIFFTQCKKTNTGGCHTCTEQCMDVFVNDNAGNPAHFETYCGSASDIQNWKNSLDRSYPMPYYYKRYTNAPSNQVRICSSGTPANDSISLYTSMGYSCY